jgi:DNA repair photolyase
VLKPVSNPPNPWHSTEVDWLGEPPAAALELYEEEARSVLSENRSADLSFRFSVNPYRGCFHACAYCYARPSHQYLDFGAGTDFDRKIVVKVNAPEVLADELARGRAGDEHLVFSGNTDCYQPLEAHYGLTRRCLEVCRDFRRPVVVITKGALVQRDAELLSELHRRAGARVVLSLAFSDAATARLVEPHTSSPERRLEAIERLAAQGVPTGLAFAPVIPGLNESAIPEVLQRAARAGARTAFLALLRLAPEVETVFRERLLESAPGRLGKILSALRDVRGGKLDERRIGERFQGQGPRWQVIEQLFEVHCRRNGLDFSAGELPEAERARKARPRQGELFES